MRDHFSGEVDIVLPWVDPADQAWVTRRESARRHYVGGMDLDAPDYNVVRYRDWGLLQYVFRGIEEYCPWVRRVHFITEGHLPAWLNCANERLNIVRHEEYIPKDYLPTFSSHPIELNLHRIDGLADRFVYFNDDTFVVAPISEEHFFPGGVPAGIPSPAQLWTNDLLSHVILNNLAAINRNFTKRHRDLASTLRWFSPRLGMRHVARQAMVSPWRRYSAFYIHHAPLALRKKTLCDVWDAEYAVLDATSRSRFREFTDVNSFLFSYWQLCSGDFAPVSPSVYGAVYHLGSDASSEIAKAILSGCPPVVCVNDGPDAEYDRDRAVIDSAFSRVFPDKSSFEV